MRSWEINLNEPYNLFLLLKVIIIFLTMAITNTNTTIIISLSLYIYIKGQIVAFELKEEKLAAGTDTNPYFFLLI